MMISQLVMDSLTKIMADHPVHQAMPFLKQILAEDSDAILAGISNLLASNDPVMIRRAYQICQVAGSSQVPNLLAAAAALFPVGMPVHQKLSTTKTPCCISYPAA